MSEPLQFDHERRVIEQHFKTSWDDTPTQDAKVKYENQAWTMPVEPWVALTIVTTEGRQIDIRENALHRYGGTVIVQVFQKERTGTGEARRLAGRIAEIFRQQTLCDDTLECGRLIFRTPSITTVGLISGWYQLNVVCPFFRDQNHQRPS